MDLILRETLKRAGVWESYKLKHSIVEHITMDLYKHSDEAARLLLDDIKMNPSDSHMMYLLDQGMEPYGEDGKVDETDPHFQEWLKDYVENRIGEAVEYMASSFTMQNGEIVLYRMITAPVNWVEQGGLTTRPLGVFWSWDEQAAEAHWGEFNNDTQQYLIVASARVQDIDWATSIFANANPSYEDEREVRLNDGASVTFHHVYAIHNRKPVEVSGHEQLVGKKLAA